MVPIETEMGRKGHLALSTSTAEVSERLSSFQEAVSIYMFLGVEIRILSIRDGLQLRWHSKKEVGAKFRTYMKTFKNRYIAKNT